MKRKGFNLNWTSVLRERKALHRGDVLLRYIHNLLRQGAGGHPPDCSGGTGDHRHRAER